MQKESKLDIVIDLFVKNQVDFFGNPQFNSKYSVYSRDRDHVRNLFTDELIAFFEGFDLKDQIIESDGENRIIIYNSGVSSSLNEVEQKIKIAKVFEDSFNSSLQKNNLVSNQ